MTRTIKSDPRGLQPGDMHRIDDRVYRVYRDGRTDRLRLWYVGTVAEVM